MSIDRGMNSEDVVHMYSGMLLSHWKGWTYAICSDMEKSILDSSQVSWIVYFYRVDYICQDRDV